MTPMFRMTFECEGEWYSSLDTFGIYLVTMEKSHNLKHMHMKRRFTLTIELQLGLVMDNFQRDGTTRIFRKTFRDYDFKKNHFKIRYSN